MAKILNIEIDTAQLRVAETDSRGLRIYRCFTLPVPQGPWMMGRSVTQRPWVRC